VQRVVTALEHDGAALLPTARAQLDDVVRRRDRGGIVLHHDDAVATVAQRGQQREQPVGVARVQADGRLVEHVERVHQMRPERVGQRDPLRLAARQRACLPVQREVAEPDVVEELDTRAELAHDRVRDAVLLRRERLRRAAGQQLIEPRAQLPDGQPRRRTDVEAARTHMQRLVRSLEPRHSAHGARSGTAAGRHGCTACSASSRASAGTGSRPGIRADGR
jgi:hypothetical protein